jgi:hypothetical protein
MASRTYVVWQPTPINESHLPATRYVYSRYPKRGQRGSREEATVGWTGYVPLDEAVEPEPEPYVPRRAPTASAPAKRMPTRSSSASLSKLPVVRSSWHGAWDPPPQQTPAALRKSASQQSLFLDAFFDSQVPPNAKSQRVSTPLAVSPHFRPRELLPIQKGALASSLLGGGGGGAPGGPASVGTSRLHPPRMPATPTPVQRQRAAVDPRVRSVDPRTAYCPVDKHGVLCAPPHSWEHSASARWGASLSHLPSQPHF